jgi:RyR domain
MTLPHGRMDALAFEGQIINWLVTQRITPGTWSHFGSGNTGDYPLVFNDDGTALCLKLKRPADVLRVAGVFPCTGLTIETLHAAVRAEASVHRFVVEDAARIAHDAIRRLYLTYGDRYPAWDDLGGETRVAFILQVRHRLEHPNEPIELMHQSWIETRVKDGWKVAAEFSEAALTDPLLVPWKRLSDRAQARYQLLASVVASLAPLLGYHKT